MFLGEKVNLDQSEWFKMADDDMSAFYWFNIQKQIKKRGNDIG